MPYEGVDPKGADIERLRIARGWSRKELGSRAKADYKTLWGIERGGQRSTRPTLQRIATELGVSLSDVMKDEPKDEPKPKRTAYPTSNPQPSSPAPPPRPTKPPRLAEGTAA